MTLEQLFSHHHKQPSDINEHLPTLLKYGRQCDHITEFGFRTGVSTTAFLLSGPKRLITYDIDPSCKSIYASLSGICNNGRTEFLFENKDTRAVEIEQTDLLFIDSLHTASQVATELKHAHRVNKYIIFHDIVTFGIVGQDRQPGIMNAINDFLNKNTGQWVMEEAFYNNNGLMVVKRTAPCTDQATQSF